MTTAAQATTPERIRAPRGRRTVDPGRMVHESIQWIKIPWEDDHAAIADAAARLAEHRPDDALANLLAAVLAQAIHDVKRGHEIKAGTRPRRTWTKCDQMPHVGDAVAWFLAPEPVDGCVSFRAVCEFFSLPADDIVRALRVEELAEHEAVADYVEPMDWGDYPRPCGVCGVTFTPGHAREMYCSNRCGMRAVRARDKARQHRLRGAA